MIYTFIYAICKWVETLANNLTSMFGNKSNLDMIFKMDYI